MTTRPAEHDLLRWSLVAVWLATAAVSAWEHDGQSARLLQSAGITDATWIALLIWSGVVVDLALGLALWLKPVRTTFRLALAAMLAMTAIATVLQPELWLHPLGPLTKNLPIAALLWVLARRPR